MHPLSRYTPGGSQTLSKMANRYPANYPQLLSHGKEGHVFDDKGREYIDLISGLGAISVGYCDTYINQCVARQLTRGVTFSLPTTLEYRAAEKLTQLVPGTDMWRFGKTGTDGVLMAVRAARAYTGRVKILSSGYHGCTDHFECLGTRKAGMVDLSDCTHSMTDWDTKIKSEEYAAVVLEPWVLEQTITEEIRKACTETGTLLIADEVVTGGRFEGFTASEHLKIKPDIYVLGKGLANGFPLCAVGGSEAIMKTFERSDFFASGTFGGETVSLAAFLATQEILTEKIESRVRNGRIIQTVFNTYFFLDKCKGYPTRLDFQLNTTFNSERKYKFWQEMCKRGILVGYNNFIMASHTSEDVMRICEAIYDVYKNFGSVSLEGAVPSEALKRV